MAEYTEDYLAGKAAYCNGLECSDNPHYKAFGELSDEYYEWNKGWSDAEDAQFRYWDDCETQEWQDYLNEEEKAP